MINIDRRGVTIFLRIYVVGALVAAALLSSPALALIPVGLLVWRLFLWRWSVSARVKLLTEYFTYLATAVLLAQQAALPIAVLVALPMMILVDRNLRRVAVTAVFRETTRRWRPTDTGVILGLITASVMVASLLLGSWALLLAVGVVVAYLGTLYIVIARRLPIQPVEEVQLDLRIVAGSEHDLNVELDNRTGIGGQFLVISPYEWLKVTPNRLSLGERRLALRVSLSPPLAGPSTVMLRGYAVDRWGLVQTRFKLEPIRLYVIPRARYAAWLAERYLAATKPGPLPLATSVATPRLIFGQRRGIEYYGSQRYQPGDSLKNIDWKHSLKYDELITKEFADFHGQPAVVLVNLAVGNVEEADQLAFRIIVTAMSLARESIPAALAAYDNEGVRLTTTMLAPRQLLLQSLQVTREMVTTINPVRYLNPPDVTRLRANIGRIRHTEGKASEVLLQLLQSEYRSLGRSARLSPAMEAMTRVLAKVGSETTVVAISHRNHDASALAFLTADLARAGTAVVSL